MPGNSNCSINIALKAVRGQGSTQWMYVSVCECVFLWYMYGQTEHRQLCSVTVRDTDFKHLTLPVIWPQLQVTVSVCVVFVTIKKHLSKKLRLLLPLPPPLSLDMLLIWQVKVSFVVGTSAFILLSAPSAQWCRSHMLLLHMTVLLLWLQQRHLPSSDHSLDKDRMRCHLPLSCSTSHCVHSYKRASSCWAYESKTHVIIHYQNC